jgi:hypothetical protein
MTIMNANNLWRIGANFSPRCISGTPQILLSTYLSCRKSPIAANRRDIRLTIDTIKDPPEVEAAILDIESWINAAVSDPKTDSIRV